jgi:4-amino-4-deoxy-L-arabinose transferase-like glycosyltransferase
LLTLCLLVPVRGKAHAIDDVTFLLQAQQVVHSPLQPTAFDLVADGERVRLSVALVSGPLMAYLLVPSVLMGGSEWVAHLVPLLLMLVAVWATVSIAFRLGLGKSAARAAGLLLASTPAVIGMATTSMADVPAMAFGVLGMERLLAWRDENRPHQWISAGLAFALAVLARSQLLLLLPVGALAMSREYSVRGLGRAATRVWAPMLLALAVIFAVSRVTAEPVAAHGDIFSATLSRLHPGRVHWKVAAFAADWVLVFPLALPWVIVRWRPMRSDRVVWAVVAISALVVLVGHNPAMTPALAPIALLGAAVLTDVLRDATRRADHDQLWLGLWLLIAVATFAYGHVPPKYLVPSAPAVAVLVARLLDRDGSPLGKRVVWATIAAGATLSVLIVLADSEFTDVGRRVARDVIAPRVRAGQRVWYDGGWGSQWYAMQAGAVMLANTAPYPAPGDYVVQSRYTSGARLGSTAGLDSLSAVHVSSHFGRVMDREHGAGFYSNWWGYLPWIWMNGEIEAVTLWRVR